MHSWSTRTLLIKYNSIVRKDYTLPTIDPQGGEHRKLSTELIQVGDSLLPGTR